ncbi:MAG TPA: DUF2238 domain-containing protein, partial [Gemmatimonadales bacterium]|nr:DUF2238 domain-containing protein [Gemmatimonadales bacterium]
MTPSPMTQARPGCGRNRPLQVITLVFAAVWLAAAVAPRDRADWAMENLLVVSLVVALAGTYRVLPLSGGSYLCIATFLTLHTVGAHYTYPQVPIGEWAREQFGWSRNHYDRLVHFGFGLFMTYPVRELLIRTAGARGFWTHYLPLEMILALSGAYELFEWGAAAVLAPELGSAYLGAQGDQWDAHRDMLAAVLGAVLGITMTALATRRST